MNASATRDRPTGRTAAATVYDALALGGFFAAACAAIVLAAAAYWASTQQRVAADWVSHTHEVLAAIARAEATLTDVESEERAYVITGSALYLRGFDGALTQLEGDMTRLRVLTSDNAGQQQRVADLASAMQAPLAAMRQVVAARRSAGFAAAHALVASASPRTQLDVLHEIFDKLESEEHRLLLSRIANLDTKMRWFWCSIAALVALLLVGLALLYVQIRRRQDEQRRFLQSEQRFHLMARAVVDYGIFLLDSEGRVASWNAGAERIKGYRESEIVGRDFSRFYPQEDIDADKPALALRAAARDGRYEEEGWRVRKDGSRFWASVVITPLRDAGGTLTGFAKITRDLSERKRAEQALHAEVAERRRIDAELQNVNDNLERTVTARTADLESANAELVDAKARLQELSSRLIAAQEEERARIARELHDETGQAMTMIRLNLRDALRNEERRSQRIEECVALVDRGIANIRNISMSLRPPMLDDLGLADALEWALERQAQAAGWRTSMRAEGLSGRLPGVIETACFRIGQEALTNVARHAHATEVAVELQADGSSLELTVSDNGRGFDATMLSTPEVRRNHFGMVSMSERAKLAGGKLDIATAPGAGTRIRVSFALDRALA